MRTFISRKFVFLIILLISFFQINAQSSCNDSIISSTNCIITSNNITFQTLNSSSGAWWIYDSLGNEVFSYLPDLSNPPVNNISFVFANSGSYNIQMSTGGFTPCVYSVNIYATNNPINLSTNNSTTICAGGSIDYNSLSINISNNIGNVNFSWVTSPSGYSWEGLVPFSIPAGENSVNLTITDILTGCSDSKNINLNYQSTSANPSFSTNTSLITCPGQFITCTANSINTNLYSYQWSIDGVTQNNGFNGILNTPIFPIDSTVNITLYVEDLSNGCIVSSSQTINTNNPQYAALDTSASHYDQELNSFVYCESDSTIIDTLNNPFNILSGVDSVIVNLGVGGTQTYTTSQGFDQFYLNLSESIYSATLTTYFSGSCAPVSVSYNIIYNKQLSSVNVNFGTCTNTNLCIGDEVSYFIDPQQFQMPLNAEILWVISCDSNNVDTIVWNQDSVHNNTYFTDADCNPSTPDEEYIVFKYIYGESSCGCYFNDNTIGDIYDQFRIIPIFVTACQSNAMTLGLTVYVPPIPTAEFTIVDSVCPPATISMYNNSEFGCQNSINPNYNPSNALYGVLNPTFYYDFGNCVDSVNVPTQTQYLSNSFQTITNTYNNAGIYHIELQASNSCTSISFSDSISIFPKPNVSFTADTVCRGISTKFISTTSTNSATVDTITCFPNDKIINVPAGLPITSYYWSMGSNQGYYANGTSNSSENPEFVFTNCGEHIVGLTVTDSLGCDSTYYSTVFVYGTPNADFSFNNFECVGNPTCVTDLSTANQIPNCYIGQLDLWQWNIKDENNNIIYSNTSSISSNFCDTLIPNCNPSTVSSDYEISLIVTDQKGCIDSSVQVNTIFCNPLANFDNSGVCFDSINGGVKSFINLSSPQNGVSFKWYFGDGDSSTTINPTHVYTNPGVYNVTLILIGNNCNDTIIKSVEVFDDYAINLTTDTILCYSQNTGFINTTPLGGFPPYNYLWSGPNGYNSTNQNLNNLYSGVYSVVITDNNGCISSDSIYIFENPLIVGTSNIDTCDIYVWNGQTITTSGSYNQTFTNIAGCDSIHTLNVIIRESIDTIANFTVCDSYTWDGTTYTTSGFYSNTYIGSNGCDSVVSIGLTIVSSDTMSSSVFACDSYLWNSQNITVSGSYNQTFTNAGGCDSVHTLNVTIENSNTGTSNIDTCDIYVWNSDTITTSGFYNQTFTNVAGCDSIHTLNATIRESIDSIANITVCDSYTWDGTTYTTSGFYSNTYIGPNGCDSVVGIDLTVVSSDSVNSSVSACNSYLWNGQNITASGSYNQTFTNAGGCDSVHTLNVTIENSNTGTSNIDTCDIYVWNSDTITTTGFYNQTFTNVAGCDSIHTLNATIRESYNETSNITVCDSIFWQGTTYTISGFYSNTYTNIDGCDSVIAINLTVESSDSVNSSISACDSYQWNGQNITASGSYNQTFTNAGGCDSVHTLNVTIENSNTGSSSIDTCDIYVWNSDTITTTGFYNQTFTNVAGCDSIHTLNVLIKESYNETSDSTVCDSFTWEGTTYTTSGFYSNAFTRANGCDSVVGINLIVNKSSIASIEVLGSLNNCAPLYIDSSLIIAVDSINGINNFYSWTINHSNGNSVSGTGIYPPLDSITNENDSAEVILFVNNNYGCNSDSTSILIRTFSNPIVNFSIDTLQGCSPLTINTDTSGTTQGANYIWTVSNQIGTILETYNYHKSSFVLSNSSSIIDSSYYISLTVNDNLGCQNTFTSNEINVFASPISEISLDDKCDGNSVYFYDNSSSPTSTITNWEWNFGDIASFSDTSTLQNPNSYVYSSWGAYNVSLIITDNNLCRDTSYQNINIYANPVSNFISNFNCETQLLCNNTLLSFNDSSYVDSFGGSITNEYWYIDNVFADSSVYTQTFNTLLDTGISNIKHIVKTQYGCLDTIAIDFEVVSTPTAGFFIADTVCGNDTSLIEMINLSNGNIIHSILEISNSLDSSIFIDTLNNDSIVNYIDLSPSNDVITYYISLTVSNCCGSSVYNDSIVILPNPQVYFVTNPICNVTPIPINNPVYLFFSNFVDTINTDSVLIDWGDGTNSGMIFPNLNGGTPVWPDLIHSYSAINTYNICITGYNDCDSTTFCCDLEVIPNQINSNFQLIDNLACQDENCGVKVRELSSPGFNNATVNWWFDYHPDSLPLYPNLSSPDLSIPYSQFDTICWTYDTPGRYFIFHEISSGQVGGPNGPTFTDTSFNLLDTVIVFPKPDINFTFNNACLYDTSTFINNSTIDNTILGIPNQSINSWQWYINGVAISSSWDLTHSFDSVGTYWIKLEAVSNYNCIASDSAEITIYDLPSVNFVSNAVCENNIMSFTDSSQLAAFPIISWDWTINNGSYQNSNQNSQNPNFIFNGCSSSNLASLEISDSFGCRNNISKNVTIYCNPIPDMTINSPLCHNNLIFFTDQSVGVSESIIDWNWNFGVNANPQFSSAQNDSTSFFLNPGIQNIQLTVRDSNNCSSTLDSSIYINNNPNANFNWNNVCANENTTFINNSVGATNQVVSYYWQFSDGGFSLVENPIYIFSVTDTIGSEAWAILEITDIAGCKDTFDSRSTGEYIEIHPLPNTLFTANAVCEGKTFTFINNSSINNIFNDSLSFPNPLWIFDNGALTSNDSIWYLNTLNPLYNQGIYNLELNMSSSFISEATNQKCSSSLNKNVEILVVPTLNPDTTWTNSQCGTDVEFTFKGNPQNVNSYSYIIEDSYNNPPPITSTHEFSYKFDYPGTYVFNQYLYNLNGCYDSIVDFLKVYPKPNAEFVTSSFSGCENLRIDFTDISYIEYDSLFENGSAEITSWNWQFDDNRISSDINPSNTYQTINGEISFYSPSLIVETNHGCSNYIQKTNYITIHPTPIAKITTPLSELGPGLYNFDASQSQTSNGQLINPDLFNFIWTTNNDTLWDNLKDVNINYQYPPNTNYPNTSAQTFYDVCLILIDENSQFQCVDTFCIEPLLFVNYFKGLNIPNALAPDDKSGQSSYFLPKGQSLKEYKIEIFDSWGNLVWQDDQLTEFDQKPATPWYGETFDNKPLPQGTYVWKIYAKFTDGSIWQGVDGKTTGSIYLIR